MEGDKWAAFAVWSEVPPCPLWEVEVLLLGSGPCVKVGSPHRQDTAAAL